MSYDFVIYVSEMTEERADEITDRWPETTSGTRCGRKYVGFTREAHSLGQALDSAITDLKSLGILPLKIEAAFPPETAIV